MSELSVYHILDCCGRIRQYKDRALGTISKLLVDSRLGLVFMIVTYDIGSLSAELKLTLLASRQGRIVHDTISWCITNISNNKTEVHDSTLAQPLFSLTSGKYKLQVKHQENLIELGEFDLKQNTRTDLVFILNTDQVGDEYFSEYDAIEDFNRRQQERDSQAEHGFATLPLRDPAQQIDGDYGSQIMAHPLLAESAQFDGVPPDMRPDPAENEAALQLTLAAQLTNQPSAHAAPTPNPT